MAELAALRARVAEIEAGVGGKPHVSGRAVQYDRSGPSMPR